MKTTGYGNPPSTMDTANLSQNSRAALIEKLQKELSQNNTGSLESLITRVKMIQTLIAEYGKVETQTALQNINNEMQREFQQEKKESMLIGDLLEKQREAMSMCIEYKN